MAAMMGAQHYYAVQPSYNRSAATGDFYVNVSIVVKAVQRALSDSAKNITTTALNNFLSDGNSDL